jgi:hypothetical protein
MKSMFCHGIGSNSWISKMNGCERFGTLFWSVLFITTATATAAT